MLWIVLWHTRRRGRFCSICDTLTVLHNINVTGLHWGAERVMEYGMAVNNLCLTTQYMMPGVHPPCCFYPMSWWLINCLHFLSIGSLLSLLCERDIWISTWGWNVTDVGIWKERTNISFTQIGSLQLFSSAIISGCAQVKDIASFVLPSEHIWYILGLLLKFHNNLNLCVVYHEAR